ncbi:hypothetical protein B0H16DRAFT_1579066, partial [Mycena metata]
MLSRTSQTFFRPANPKDTPKPVSSGRQWELVPPAVFPLFFLYSLTRNSLPRSEKHLRSTEHTADRKTSPPCRNFASTLSTRHTEIERSDEWNEDARQQGACTAHPPHSLISYLTYTPVHPDVAIRHTGRGEHGQRWFEGRERCVLGFWLFLLFISSILLSPPASTPSPSPLSHKMALLSSWTRRLHLHAQLPCAWASTSASREFGAAVHSRSPRSLLLHSSAPPSPP